ncbi:MAG: alpha-keto acid decarboxylase family protein [Nitrospirae bacterium]|nr:alpha-keto acid decarboxylase family protein [Nitrospirota bacterium]
MDTSSSSEQLGIGKYLLKRLSEEGVGHIFGIPGDYIIYFYDQLVHSKIRHIGTTREDAAAFAADGYARCRGMGALAVTYGVGALNVVNAVAGAYAESSPVVVISGAPGVREQRSNSLLHHRFGPFTFQREIFERITCMTAVLDDPLIAFRQIDRALAAARLFSKPVYIELPRDMVDEKGYILPSEHLSEKESDPETLKEAVEETIRLLERADSPAVLAGLEIQRRGLQDSLVCLIERASLPVAATLTGKSVVGERHPAYFGVYEGAIGDEAARRLIEDADLLLMLGVTLNDVDTGIYTARLDPNRMVRAIQDEVIIRHHRFPQVYLKDFLSALGQAIAPRTVSFTAPPCGPSASGFPEAGRPMTVARLIGRLNQALTGEMLVVCDTGDCLFASVDLRVHERSEFLASSFYTTMGFAVPAALGAQVARPDLRPLVLVGDGAFQMTGTEISTIARLGINAIIIVFNNAGYSTERFIMDGSFNDISAWRFHRLSEVMGPMHGYDVHTEDEFEKALENAISEKHAPTIINVHLSKDDASPVMRRLARLLGERAQGG